MLRRLQLFLSASYGIDPPEDVREYLVTDADWLRAIEGDNGRETDEKLLILEQDGELELALYLAPELLSRLTASDPLTGLNAANLADFCTVVEGVSHFNYLVWNAAANRRVTRLELEMQAEVDKYLSVRAFQPVDRHRDLARVLYDRPQFEAALDAEELERYTHACRFAGWYCRSLNRRYAAGPPGPPMLDELRHFFRLPQPEKLSHIHASAYACS